MLPLISSLLVASASSSITYTTNCMNADFKYEKDCRTNYSLVSDVEDIKISRFETKVNYIYEGELNNFELRLPKWIQKELVTRKHKKEEWFGDNWKRVKVRAVRQKIDKTAGKFEDITQPTVFYNYANCVRNVFSSIPEGGKSVARNWVLSHWDYNSVTRSGFPLIEASIPVHFKHLCPKHYDNLSFRTGCGAGCHWKHQQIGEPIDHSNGWRKAWFKSKQYYFDHKSSKDVQGNPWRQRLLDLDIPEDEISDGISEGWVYAHCNRKKVAFGNPSDSNVFDAFDKNGNLIKGSVNRSTGTYYQRLCPYSD